MQEKIMEKRKKQNMQTNTERMSNGKSEVKTEKQRK